MASKSVPRLRSPDQLSAPTAATVAEYRSTLASIIEQLVRLKDMTERYPVYLMLAGNSYRFNSPSDLDSFIEQLRARIHDYEQAC